MTPSLSRSDRPIASRSAAGLLAIAWAGLTIGIAVAPAPAQAAGGAFYRAELAAPAPDARPIASGQVWHCADNACVSGKGTSRPAIVCARLAKQVGEITAFVADGKALDAEQLARCNKR